MSLSIIDCKQIANDIIEEVKNNLSIVQGRNPVLYIIQVGDNNASNVYIKNKIKSCKYVGIHPVHIKTDESISEEELIYMIREMQCNNFIDGILVQLPLPDHINKDKIINIIDPSKDVDGFTTIQSGMLFNNMDNDHKLLPCTAKGIIRILKSMTDLEGKNITVVGRSNIVGKPVTMLLQEENATVTMCHSKTKNIEEYTRMSDIIILATGKPKLFNKRFFYSNKNKIIIDVGINRDSDGKLCGDLDVESIKEINNINIQYTSVPGGVGLVTVAELIDNVYKSFNSNR